MMIVGLTGSIAIGKSAVASVFKTQGIPVFEADQEVHRLYDSSDGADLLQPLVPDAIINGRVDRAKLTAIALKNPQKLNEVETVVHRYVANRKRQFIDLGKSAGHDIIVLDIPLLFEKHLQSDVDVIVVVSAPANLQRERALARPGMTQEKLDMILSRQWPDADKRAAADYVIENNGSLLELETKTLSLLALLKAKV
jgi:dephospho-CoA kinase